MALVHKLALPVVALVAVAAAGALLLQPDRDSQAQATTDPRVDLFRDRLASFQTLYLPIHDHQDSYVFSADARREAFDTTWGPWYDGTHLYRDSARLVGPEWDAAIAAIWAEVRAGLPNTAIEPIVEPLPSRVRGLLGRGKRFRLHADIALPGAQAIDVLIGLDDHGNPTGLAVVEAGSYTLIAERETRLLAGLDNKEIRWDVPLMPGLGGRAYGPRPPCSHEAGQAYDTHCEDIRNHDAYHDTYLRYEVAIDPALSSTSLHPDGWHLAHACTGVLQTWTAPIDLEFPVRATDEGYTRMAAARAAQCPIGLDVWSHTAHFPGFPNVRTRALGSFSVVDTSVSPAVTLFTQAFDETLDGPPNKSGDRKKRWDIPPTQSLAGLTVRWTGTLTLTCKASAGVTPRPVGVSIQAPPPVFYWPCYPEELPSTE